MLNYIHSGLQNPGFFALLKYFLMITIYIAQHYLNCFRFSSLMGEDIPLTFSMDYAENLPSPRFVKSHLPVSMLPKELFTVKPKVST